MHAADLWFKLQGSVIELKAAQSFSQWLKLLCIRGEQSTIHCRHDLNVPCNQNGLPHVGKQASFELRYQNTREPVGCTAFHILYTGAVTFVSAVVALHVGCFANNIVWNHALGNMSCGAQHHLPEPQLLVAFLG